MVVADNVLKPGAPKFLWELSHSEHYDMQLLEVGVLSFLKQDPRKCCVRSHSGTIGGPDFSLKLRGKIRKMRIKYPLHTPQKQK